MKSVDCNVLLRSFAICLVVVNHSIWIDLGGGMNFLLLLSGFNFARFSLIKNKSEAIYDLWKLVYKIVIPSLLIILLYSFINERMRVEEILMFSNFMYLNKVTDIALPIWYPQVLLQLVIIISFLLYVTPEINKESRGYVIISFYFGSLVIYEVSKQLYDSSHLLNRIPTLHLWNFVLGWVLWILLEDKNFINKSISSFIVFIT
ncbi:hypothetical protein BIZ37_27940, partial [Photobacterium sp. BZF1]|uniref:hypothetical protein n=1 Tax=Photobacterium sp. BZF1 TaxID=1904457 RepID=UPI0016538065